MNTVNVKKLYVLFIVLILAVSGSAFAQKTFKCEKCGETITGSYFETNGDYFHPEHFTCKQCKEPINGKYVTNRGDNYHIRCYEKNVALKCGVCGGVIKGEHHVDYWGNKYHTKHKNDTKSCEYCSRYISEMITGGGVRYSDGRYACNICRESAVTEKHDANRIMSDVARRLGRLGIGVDPGAVELRLVGLDKMQQKTGKGSNRLTGFTDFAQTKRLLGLSTERKITIYLLYGMPRMDAVSTMAHELTHVFQFVNGKLENDRALSEGSCNYAAYLVLQDFDGKQVEYVMSNLENDEDEIYGEGFRRVKRFVSDHGLRAWLELLKKKNHFPDGY